MAPASDAYWQLPNLNRSSLYREWIAGTEWNSFYYITGFVLCFGTLWEQFFGKHLFKPAKAAEDGSKNFMRWPSISGRSRTSLYLAHAFEIRIGRQASIQLSKNLVAKWNARWLSAISTKWGELLYHGWPRILEQRPELGKPHPRYVESRRAR